MSRPLDLERPGAELSPAWAGLLRLRARRGGADLSAVVFGAGRPWPRIQNEAGRIDLGRVFLARGVRLWAHKGGALAIGDGTVLDENAEVVAWNEVRIGRGCYLGWDVLILDTDLHEVAGRPLNNRPVLLGDHVYVGCRAVILKGVRVGSGAVIHPGAIVTRDVPDGGAARGPEATLIRRCGNP